MPPKNQTKKKETAKKTPTIVRPDISDSSLVYVPDDAVEGYQERIETGLEWTLTAEAARHHKKIGFSAELPVVTFKTALQNKINKSILHGFLDENNTLSLQEQWELLLITLWDNEKFGSEEEKICFQNDNNLTDDMVKLIKKAVFLNNRKVIHDELKQASVLRLIGAQMTMLREDLTNFPNLSTLNLCGNFIEELHCTVLPPGLRVLELQANRITNIEHMADILPENLMYLGLAKNILTNGSFEELHFHSNISVLDISNNDIYHLQVVLDALATLHNLTSLQLAGNPCSMCAAYAELTISKLPRLQWLDSRQILPTDHAPEPFEPHPHDLRSNYFYVRIFRIMGVLQPPKPEKGSVATFHVEFELPLLDHVRRQFLMFRRNESLIELLLPPEDEEFPIENFSISKVASTIEGEISPHPSDIYRQLVTKNPREIHHYTTFESTRISWNKILTFQDPIIKIFCPDLVALRDTFRTVITMRLIYSLTTNVSTKGKDKKGNQTVKLPTEQRATLATIRCNLKNPDWSQPSQHFHWDDSLETEDAIHWGDGDLSILQYTQTPAKASQKNQKVKPNQDQNTQSIRQQPPENLTCHFGFEIMSTMK